ncbi:MAG TPA: hypothetical protein VF755_29665, partial [Catenuloplanes sp.]
MRSAATVPPAGPFTVWLASYPKSGNTWARAVMRSLCEPPRGSRPGGPPVDINALEGGPIASCRYALDARLGFASSDLLPDEIDALRPACDAALDRELTGVWFRKVHDGLFTGPGATPIVPPAATRAVAYLVRDPRDVAVSFAHFSARPPSWAVEQMANPDATLVGQAHRLHGQVRQRLGTWSDHVAGWTGHDLFP